MGSTGAGRVMTRWIFDRFHFEHDGEEGDVWGQGAVMMMG